MSAKAIILDPGHGLGNRAIGRYDTGAVAAGVEEATIAMDYVNEIRALLQATVKVVRTRANAKDPAPVFERASVARRYNGVVMLSVHCNEGGGRASGVEVFYRGNEHKNKAAEISATVAKIFGIPDRGAKTESESQHSRLAIMSFQPCFLLELGFIDNATDRKAILDPAKRLEVAEKLSEILLTFI
jgi:N-acetylmuramoyl-L-alanine amidase